MSGDVGRLLLVLGLAAVVAGVALIFADRIPWLGRLPGDIRIERGNWWFYFPLATSLIISLVLTVILNLFRR